MCKSEKQAETTISNMRKEKQEELLHKYRQKETKSKIFELIKIRLSESGRELFSTCGTFHQFITTQDKKKCRRVKGNDCKIGFVRFVRGGNRVRMR